MSKKLTHEQIVRQAKALGVPVAGLYAVIEVEAKGEGFLSTGHPVILFERHWMWRLLREQGQPTIAARMRASDPDICNPTPGGYGSVASQPGRLSRAAAFHRDVALQSASWGLGQVMGGNWKSLGYDKLQEFINAMFRSEEAQLEAMCRFIRINNLVGAITGKNWARFARVYNGPNYAINSYDKKLAAAYQKHFVKYGSA